MICRFLETLTGRGAHEKERVSTHEIYRSYFSLLELLVVIGVISILSGLLMVAVRRARDSSKRMFCLNNLKQIGVGVNVYVGECKRMPVASQLPSANLNSDPRIVDVLETYVEEVKLFKCPLDAAFYTTEGSSYEYNSMLNGRTPDDVGKHRGMESVLVMFDYQHFHGRAGKPGSTNYLFGDGHVSDLK